jgi:hypothetical protein
MLHLPHKRKACLAIGFNLPQKRPHIAAISPIFKTPVCFFIPLKLFLKKFEKAVWQYYDEF